MALSEHDPRKQSLYFPEDMLNEIRDEAARQERSLSWIVQAAWRIARGEISQFPSVNDVLRQVARGGDRGGRCSATSATRRGTAPRTSRGGGYVDAR